VRTPSWIILVSLFFFFHHVLMTYFGCDSIDRCVYILAEGQVILGDLDDPNAALGGHIGSC
jgi:hypothetical protein